MKIERILPAAILCICCVAGVAFASEAPKQIDPAVQAEFDTFTKNYLDKIRNNMCDTASARKLTKNSDGFVGTYSEVDAESRTIQVKTSSSKACPFIGVMRYKERHYSCEGGNKSQAAQGPCNVVKVSGMTEIFRYSDGKWQH
jgi:hypothetical protein